MVSFAIFQVALFPTYKVAWIGDRSTPTTYKMVSKYFPVLVRNSQQLLDGRRRSRWPRYLCPFQDRGLAGLSSRDGKAGLDRVCYQVLEALNYVGSLIR